MSLPPLTPQVAELRGAAPGSPPPQDPDPQPPSSKRLRLEEPGGVSEAGWRLPLVPRLSEAEKEWALSPRPFGALLLSPEAIFGHSADLREEKPARGKQIRNLGCQNSGFEMNACLQPPPSGSLDSGSRASRRFSGAGLCDREAVSAPRSDRSHAEVGQLRPDMSLHDTQGPESEDGKRHLVPGRGQRRTDNSSRKPAGNLWRDLTFHQETNPTFHQGEDRWEAGSATQSNKKERNIPASVLKIPKSQSQPGVKMAKPGFSRESSTGPLPGLPADSKSRRPPVYLKERAKKKSGKKETFVTGSTDSYGPQNRRTVKRRRFLDDKNLVDAGDGFPECCERKGRSVVSNRSICVRGESLTSLQHDKHSGIESDVREPDRNVTITLQNANREEAETCLDCCMSTRLEKCPSENYNVRHILRKNRENSWVMHNYQTNCENTKKTGEKWNLLQLSDTAHLSQEDYYNIKAMNTHEEQPKLLMIGTLGSQKALINFFWLSGKGENNNMLQLPLQYYTSQKYFYLSNIFVNFITERFYSHKGISANEADNSILAWHEILKCLKHTDVHNLIISNINVNRRNNIYLQTGVSKALHIILKANIASLLNNFDSLTGTENDSKLEEGCIFKWIMCLNFPKNITVENHIIYLGRTLTFSIPLQDNMKPMLEKKKLFKTEQVFKEFKKQPINSFSVTTKNIVLMDFDDRDEISYKSKTCPEQVMNVKNWAQCSTNTVKMHVNSLPQFIQNNYEYINENFCEINMHNENLDTERKQEHNKISSFNCKCIVEDIFNVRQQAIPASHYTKRTEQTNPMILTQVQNFGSLLKSEMEAKRHDLILKEEENVIAQSLTYCHQVHKDIKIEKKEKNRFYSLDGTFSVQPVALISREENVEETKYVNQHNLADKKEYESILQESELANLKHFYPKNDSTECVQHQFEADLRVGNNACFQDLTAKCLPTEAMTIAKDFEMKSKFDLVLEELHMFHKISKENEILSTVETNNGQENYFRENNAVETVKTKIKKDLKIGTVNKICASSLLCDAKAGPNMHKRHHSLFNWETVQRNREQEVPNEHSCLRTSEEEVLYSTSEEDCEKPSPKRSAFSSDEFKEEKIHYIVKGGSNFSHGISRVLPLKTCSRPIRVGLSRKAKLRQLHPYLK
ncbi:RAD51-associated protein 2 [Eptesicus fuscus]|uniref:RAD51-associated protein 2 n=1 Tax=Eptesicus fuscus TaxID=29078 RepID=UPI0024045F13|nr:RAD51-associated protein 2 [Eptesicus fuscus]